MDEKKMAAALRRFDDENARDPNRILVDGVERPRELAYAGWLTDWVLKLCPGASVPLRLAARCQHLCRWEIPRSSYPQTRAGYLKWREDLKKFHAQRAGEILRELGFDSAVIDRVQNLNQKENLGSDQEVQILEDALCLVFLERQLGELAEKASEEKVITALQKSWAKMSIDGRVEALKLQLPPREEMLVKKALA